MDSSKVKCNDYDGKGDVKNFITKVELVAAIKGYVDEKKSQYLASKLVGPAFDVYVRLSVEDKKDFDKVKEELLKEFERGQINREEAIYLLNDRRRKPEESPQTYAYKLLELVKLAYPTFTDAVRKTLAKDAFMRGVHPEIHTQLKTWDAFRTSDVNALATRTVELELAGIKSYGKKHSSPDTSVNQISNTDDTMICAIADKVAEKLKLNTCSNETEGNIDNVSYASSYGQGYQHGRGTRGGRGSGRGRGSRGRFNRNTDQRICRGCKSTGHIVRNCPTRFCQACGQRGHDQNSETCPNNQA